MAKALLYDVLEDYNLHHGWAQAYQWIDDIAIQVAGSWSFVLQRLSEAVQALGHGLARLRLTIVSKNTIFPSVGELGNTLQGRLASLILKLDLKQSGADLGLDPFGKKFPKRKKKKVIYKRERYSNEL